MSKTTLIIDSVTGTILNLEDCYVVNPYDLSEEQLETLDNGPDSSIGEIAEKNGKSLRKILSDTGYGDNKYRWTVSYSPDSLSEEFEELLASGYLSDDTYVFKAVAWYLNHATDEQKSEFSDWVMSYESVWESFRETLFEAITDYYNEETK